MCGSPSLNLPSSSKIAMEPVGAVVVVPGTDNSTPKTSVFSTRMSSTMGMLTFCVAPIKSPDKNVKTTIVAL